MMFRRLWQRNRKKVGTRAEEDRKKDGVIMDG